MKKRYRYLVIAAALFAFLMNSSTLLQAQEKGKNEKASKSSFSPYWFVGGNLGFNQYFGDLNLKDRYQPIGEWRESGSILFGRQFSSLFGLRGQFLYAGLYGERDSKTAYMRGEVFDYNLNGTLNILNLIKNNPDRRLNVYGFVGIGQAHSRTRLREMGTKKLIDKHGYDGKGIDGRALLMVVPYGAGLTYSLTDKLDLTFETSIRVTNTDKLDSYVAVKKHDQYGPTTIGLNYNFGKGANLKKMVRDFNKITYTVTPQVLEAHGDSVRVQIVGRVPENYFHKKAAINFEPVLKYATGETRLKPITLIGEDVKGDGIRINQKNGGTFTYTYTFPYKPEMAVSDLVVDPLVYQPKGPVTEGTTRAQVIANEKYLEVPQVYLVPGVIITPQRILHDENVIVADHGYEKETFISKEGLIYFQVNLFNLNWNLPLNKDPKAKAALKELEDFLRKGYKIRDIAIDAWASPEGEESFNQGLSDKRSKTGLKYTHDLLKKLVKEKNSLLTYKNVETEINYKVRALGEDWDGFMKALQASNIKDKNIIANVVNSQPDVKKREQEIRNMTIIYKEIEELILPPLRRVLIKVTAYEPKKTDDEISKLAITAPGQLTEAELLYAATLTKDEDVMLNIYKSAITLFPNSYKGFNNASALELKKGNLAQAREHLKKAQELASSKPEVLNNLGVLESKSKNFKKAETYYADAKKVGANVDYNLGIVMISKGDYSRAVSLFANKTCNHNVALAQLLNGNAAGASQTAKCAPEKAITHYLSAVIAARMNDNQGAISSLKKAIAADASLKNVAVNDREFLKMANSPEFKDLMK